MQWTGGIHKCIGQSHTNHHKQIFLVSEFLKVTNFNIVSKFKTRNDSTSKFISYIHSWVYTIVAKSCCLPHFMRLHQDWALCLMTLSDHIAHRDLIPLKSQFSFPNLCWNIRQRLQNEHVWNLQQSWSEAAFYWSFLGVSMVRTFVGSSDRYRLCDLQTEWPVIFVSWWKNIRTYTTQSSYFGKKVSEHCCMCANAQGF